MWRETSSMTHQQLTQKEQSAKACVMGTSELRLFAPVMTMGAFILYGSWHKEEIKMSVKVDYIVDTQSKEEKEKNSSVIWVLKDCLSD